MKTIGMIGGMSWESTSKYYREINQGIKNTLGGLHSAKIALYSVDFDEIEKLQHADDWEATATILTQAAKAVEASGADFLLICTNTMHKVAPQIEAGINIPLIHIADATAEQLRKDGVERVGLLGTRFTMEQDFYRDRLTQRFGIEVLIPEQPERELVHRVIYDELCLGKIADNSRREYLSVMAKLAGRGAQAIILGCTEIALLVQQQHTAIHLYDTTQLHCAAAVRTATAREPQLC
ncbi:MAG: aspartate racemase [Gammaproteobacteria bacterium TMED107]|nr:aspartate racemase [Gammaproteobacteria bacterium]OUX76899.1 MAG: aspartate racemase [Gammaproteobacteria bacterium TMED107]